MQQVSPSLAPLGRYLPKSPRFHLLRERLLAPLLLSDCRLSLLHGPAGSGKTTLMADCAREADPNIEVIWLDLNGRAPDRQALFTLLHQALGETEPYRDEMRVLERLRQRDRPLWLMLDDFPRSPDTLLDAALGQLLAIQNGALRWWLTARRRPQCGLPRLLMEDQLLIVGPDALFFNEDEVTAYLAGQDRHEHGQAHRLFEKTRGWCGAVAMHALSAERGAGSQALAAARDDVLSDYLRQEVLDELPAGLAWALCALSLLQRFNRSLCASVLADARAEEYFEALRDRDLLRPVELRDAGWFSVHPVLAGVLAGQVERDLASSVHRRACDWLEAAGELRLAIDHALAAGSPARAVRLLERLGNSQLLDANQAFKVLEWSRDLPADLIHGAPDLIIINALVLALATQAGHARRCLEQLNRFLPAASAQRQRRLLAAAQTILALTGLILGEATVAEENSHQALASLTDQDWILKRTCHAVLMRLHLFFGELDAARQLIEDELKRVRLLDSPTAEALVELYHAELLELEGRLPHAQQVLERSWIRLKSASLGETGVAARVQLQLGQLSLLRGQLSPAAQHFTQGYRIALAFYDPTAVLGLLKLAKIATFNEETTKAESLINQAEQLAQSRRVSESLYRNLIDLERARLCLARGEMARAQQLLEGIIDNCLPARSVSQSFGNRSTLLECERLLAVVEQHKGERARAAARLARALAQAEHLGLRLSACELRLMLTLDAQSAGAPQETQARLQQCLQEAEAMDFLLPVEQLRRSRPELFERIAQRQRSDLLSAREIEVLELVAAGHSNQEIAERLFISVFTVKSHVQRLSMKLEVKRRTQAIAKAKSLGILK